MSTQQISPETPDEGLIHGLTTAEIQKLGQQCTDAKERAYCPYSHFKVGCAILLKNPQATPIIGANVENAAYPVGTCAERVALATAVVQGYKYGDFRALAVATNSEPGSPASPCGMCRQFIREFCEPSTPIIMFDREGEWAIKTLEELLPMSFGPGSLPSPEQLDKVEADMAKKWKAGN